MEKKLEKEGDLERRVFEVRRTTMVPLVSKERFVFEHIGGEWNAAFAAATKYTLTQMKEIVATMEKLPDSDEVIKVEDK